MNVENYIKNEAKDTLKGNWIKAITSLFTAVLVFIAVMLVIGGAFEIMGDYDSLGSAFAENPLKIVFFLAFHLIAVVGLIILSPVIAGCVKIFASISKNENVNIEDVFAYFSTANIYKDCVKFMTRIIVTLVAILILFELPCLEGYLLFSDKDYASVIVVILGLLGFIGAYLFSLKYLFALFLYTDGLNMTESFNKGTAVAKGNISRLIRLTFSFGGWIISLFLIVPFIYVIPYMLCSYFVSTKYLIEQHDKANTVFAQSSDLRAESPNSTNASVMFSNPNYVSAQNCEPLTLNKDVHYNDSISLNKGGTVENDL